MSSSFQLSKSNALTKISTYICSMKLHVIGLLRRISCTIIDPEQLFRASTFPRLTKKDGLKRDQVHKSRSAQSRGPHLAENIPRVSNAQTGTPMNHTVDSGSVEAGPRNAAAPRRAVAMDLDMRPNTPTKEYHESALWTHLMRLMLPPRLLESAPRIRH